MTDWRLRNLERLRGATFRFTGYKAPSEQWDHDHCAGCWAKFAEFDAPDILHEGYVHFEPHKEGPEPEFITQCKEQGMRVILQPVIDGCRSDWVCSDCFREFREELGWKEWPAST